QPAVKQGRRPISDRRDLAETLLNQLDLIGCHWDLLQCGASSRRVDEPASWAADGGTRLAGSVERSREENADATAWAARIGRRPRRLNGRAANPARRAVAAASRRAYPLAMPRPVLCKMSVAPMPGVGA